MRRDRRLCGLAVLLALGFSSAFTRSLTPQAPPRLCRKALGPELAASCLAPSLLGLWRSEYGVSYGYGTAVAASGYLLLKSLAAVPKLQPLCKLQVLCLVLYGLRRGPPSATR
ncbi:unnamed protein product [Effrenium voratum]|nr:unnamed protein product [Effrenium voratum]